MSWNVEDDILLRGEFVTPEKKKKRKKILVNSDFLQNSVSGQFLAGFLAGFEKNLIRHCLESGLESNQILAGLWRGTPAANFDWLFSFILILFLVEFGLHFCSFLAGCFEGETKWESSSFSSFNICSNLEF